MTQQSLHHALDRDVILRAISSFYGITTADGNTDGTTLICQVLIGVNDFIKNKIILLDSGAHSGESGWATSFDPLTGQITVNPAFNGQVLAGTAFYVLNILNTVDMLNRPLPSLYEGWQEPFIDPTIWQIANPATGGAWFIATVAPDLVAQAAPNASENARLVGLTPWVFGGIAPLPTHAIVRRLVLEFELSLQNLANFNNAAFLLGWTRGFGDTRATNNIIGFALTGAGNALQTVTDLGGVETVTTGFGENLAVRNKLRIELYRGHAAFFLNEVQVADHMAHVPESPFFPNFYVATTVAGAATINLGIVRVWVEDLQRDFGISPVA